MSRSSPQPDDFLSAGFNAMNVAESYNSVGMMNPDAMDDVYDYAATNVLPRHAPLSGMDQVQAMSQDFVMQDYMTGMDYAPCTSAMDTSSMLATDSWTGGFRGPPSPPDEHEIARQLAMSRHALYPQDTMGCEPLGISRIQPYR